MQNKFYSEPTEQKETSSSTSYAPVPEPQQSNYQTVPIPTLSPARSTPNLGSSGANKQLQSRSIQQQQTQGSIPQLSVVSSHQQVNDLGKQYPPTSSSHSHQKLYNNHFGSSSSLAQQSASSALQLQQLHSNDKVFSEPGRYPSTPNLQKSDSSNALSTSSPSESNSHSENHNVESSSGQQYNSNTSATNSNNINNPNVGAMSTSNDATSSGLPNSVGGNWNSIDTQCMLLNNNINNNNNNSAPVRDSSSLKQIRYGPGHEKYPSWPIPVSSAQQIDPAGESQPIKLVVGSGSTRSKSWTEQTDYPKEKTPSYARPYMKRVNHSYTQQLKTVMEKCERIPPEAFTSQADPQLLQSVLAHANASRHNPHHHQSPHGLPKTSEGSIVPPPLLYRDLLFSQQNGHMNTNYNTHQMLQYYQSQLSAKSQQSGSGNEKEYMIPSPPERDFSEPQNTVSKPLTQEDLELYTKKYEELITQYPQSEGYHSYMSSDGSSYISSGTPFLDQLRRESENNQQFWSGDKSANGAGGGCDPNDPLFGLVGGQLAAAVSGRESVTTVVTNSSSNSSGTETLKWHGSTSDISLSSGVGGNTGSISNFKSNSHNHNSARKSGSSSTSMLNKGWNEQQNIANSSRLSTPQKQHAGNSDAMCSHPSQQSSGVVHLRNKLEQLNGSPSLKKWQSNNGDTAAEQSNSNKTGNNSNNNSSVGGGGSYAPNLKKFPLNTYTRPNTLLVEKGMNSNNVSNSSSATSTPEKMAKLLQSLNAEASNTMNLKGAKSLSHSLSSPVIDTSKPPSVAERIMELEQQTHQQSSSSPSTSGTSSPKIGQGQSSDNLAFLGTTTFMKSSSLNNLQNSPGGLYIDEGNNVQSQQQQQQNEWLSSSQGGRSNTVSPRGMLSSFSSSSATKLTSDNSSSSGSSSGLSYSYLDPDKKHKVADMTLKAIQKKALLSYYERHKGKCANNSSSSSVSSSDSNSGTPDVVSLEKDLCFSGKSNRLMLSLPKEHNVGSVDQHQNAGGGMLSENTSSRNSTSSSSGMNPSASSSPSLTGGYRAISASSSGVSSSSSTSSRINSASNPKVSSQSQHQQLLNGANHNNSPKTSQSSSTITTTGLCEEISTQVDKSESRQSALQCSTPDVDSIQGSESARLAYMSKYLPHLVNREPASSSSSVWPSNSLPKLPQGSAERTSGSTAPVTQEPAPIPPERPPKKPHLRNLAQQAHEESNDSKPPPPLPRAPVRPPALLNNGTSKSTSISSHTTANAAPPIPSKPTMSVSSGGMGVVRSPSPDELPPPPPPPTSEEMEAFLNDEPLPPPPPSVTEGDSLLGPRSRSVSGLSSCLHKDSYMAQRKERTLGYEGRYRRTLSPSGLGSNNSNAKSSPESTSLGSSDSVGSTRSVTNLATGKLDTTLSPSAWEKFHNIRPPSTTVIFTSHELSKAVGAPPATTATTSSSPHPPSSQPLFHRSISCDSNIFNNKTGASQSSIPPPVAQVAPLRGSSTTTNYNGAESAFEKCSQGGAYRNDVNVCGGLRDGIPVSTSQISALSLKSCNGDNGNQLATRENLSNIIDSGGSCERDERYFREQLYRPPESNSNKKELDDHKEQVVPVTSVSNCRTTGISYSNSVLPSVIVPPLQYERCDKETMSNGATLLSPLYTGESHTILKKSEVSLRVNCTSDVALQTDLVHGISQKDRNRKEGKENTALTSSSESELPVATLHNPSPTPEGCPTNKGCNLSSSNNASNSTASFYTGRQKTQEELECEELSRDIAKLLPQGDKLQTLLVPLPDHKTTADYMEGLFHLELKLQPETMERRGSQGAGPVSIQEKLSVEMIQESGIMDGLKLKSQVSPVSDGVTSQNQKTASETGVKLVRTESGLVNKSTSNLSTEFSHKISRSHSHKTSDPSPAALIVSSVTDTKAASISSLNDADRKSSNMLTSSYRRCNGHAPLPADSAYFTTSESKAKFLTQYNSDITKDPISGTDGVELDKQKEELVSRISKKLDILRTEQLVLREEIQSNEQLGQMVVERVKQTAKRNEFDKFKLHVEEIEKITSLLLGISGRLARAENALMGLSDPPNPQEKKILESKRDKLREQLDEAKILKENIDRRSAQVSSFLQKYLTVEEYADYDHFVKMKAKLIIDAREIDDKIKLGEEQLGALKDALNTTLPLSPNSSSS
ncbi:unnamed protein product [Orchesella dallaii]